MNNIKSEKWIFHSLLLYTPFLIEFLAHPLFMKIQPLWLASALFFICYTYLFYGAAIFIHSKWRKSVKQTIDWKISATDLKPMFLALLVGILFSRVSDFMLNKSQTPMIIAESFGFYFKMQPLWMGIVGYLLQFTYYMFEFTLVSIIIDCSQKAAQSMGWFSKIPWGGIFLGLTWCLGHSITKGQFAIGLSSFALSLIAGITYLLLGRKPIYAWIVVAAVYQL